MNRSIQVALVLGVVHGSRLATQELPRGKLPACDTDAPQSYPCATPFDTAPVALNLPVASGGARKTPRVWVFVSDSGVVQATQIAQPAGLDFDVAAIALAKQLRFTPASRAGRAVAVWFVLPITTEAAPTPCSDMAVPISAGWATFADSQHLERPELGTLYHYRGFEGAEGLALDVLVYPQAGWPPLEEQVQAFPKTLDLMQQRGEMSSYEVLGRDEIKVKVRSARLGREITIHGLVVRVKLQERSGRDLNSYFAFFPQDQQYIRFRVTYPSDRRVQGTIDDFVKQVLEARRRACALFDSR
jgi:hypothetical protein